MKQEQQIHLDQKYHLHNIKNLYVLAFIFFLSIPGLLSFFSSLGKPPVDPAQKLV